MRSIKTYDGLLMKFGAVFLAFTLATLLITGVATYASQMASYREQQKNRLHNIGSYISVILNEDGDDFIRYQDYFLRNYENIPVPRDFTIEDIAVSRRRFEALFRAACPDAELGADVQLDELAKEIRDAWAVWKHEYYLTLFEEATRRFDLQYVYYVVPDSETGDVCYVFDILRDEAIIDGVSCIDLGITVNYPREEHRYLYEAWETGRSPDGYDAFDNEFGKTRAWFTPLIVEGRTLGVICAEVTVDSGNGAIRANTISQLIMIMVILFLVSGVTLAVLDRVHIERIERLAHSIDRYAREKDAGVAADIERESVGHDEVAALCRQTADMILEIENYMNSLVNTTTELTYTKAKADAMTALAKTDALTGAFNRNAYDEEAERLNRQIAEGGAAFGLAMIDVNYLKHTNDTYGHEQGDASIRNCCCLIRQVFAHSPVYRIGGDEFAVILENEDYRGAYVLSAKFRFQIRKLAGDHRVPQQERFSAAIGYALYDPARDKSVDDVFKRADEAMYADKRKMKAIREE